MLFPTSAECHPVRAPRSAHCWSNGLFLALAITAAAIATTKASVQPEVGRHEAPLSESENPSSAAGLVLGNSRGILVKQIEDDDADDDEIIHEKRKAGRFASFRSDLGKRRADLSDNDDPDVNDDVKRAVYRMRGGKAFKADLGKRPSSNGRGVTLFRSDLGKRSAGYGASGLDDWEDVAVDGGEAELEPEMDVERRAGRLTPMFRSDLGKRVLVAAPTRGESIRRMFRADLGKRAPRVRVPFRHDLG